MVFGRKKVTPPSGPTGPSSIENDRKNHPGHQAVLRHFLQQEKEEPYIREAFMGGILFDQVYAILKTDRGARIEDMLAALASVGGQACIRGIFDTAPSNATMEQMGLKVIRGNDGYLYFFGDPPNRLLLESSHSLLSLAFGAAQAFGAPVTMGMIEDELRKVASSIGGPEFEMLDLPHEHRVERPSEWVRHLYPILAESLDFYDVPPLRRATALGYALQKAIEAAKDSIGPMLAARIVLQCATRTAKIFVK